jgi:hypothetical protein
MTSMRSFLSRAACLSAAAALSLTLASGCDPQTSAGPKSAEAGSFRAATSHEHADHQHEQGHSHAHDDDHDHGHQHASEGPHHGALIELGGDEYHAELVHDETAGTITVYVLDGSAAKASPIDAKEIVINLAKQGKPRQFALAPRPQEGDNAGKSSRFVSNDKDLGEALHDDAAQARLVLSVGGKTFSGELHGHHHHD